MPQVETLAKSVTKKTSAGKYVPIGTLIAYAEQGLTNADIGKLVGISHQAIYERFAKIGYSPKNRKQYQEHKAEIYETIQIAIANALSEADWKKVSPAQAITSLAILEDKIRLLRGQSTANVSVLSQIIASAHQQVNTPAHTIIDDNKSIDAQVIDTVDNTDNDKT